MLRVCALLCLAFHALPAAAQEARLHLQLAGGAPAAIGDTLTVEVHADARGLELTSVSAYISFDDAVFALVPASAAGAVQPFVSGPFLPGQIYENSTAGDAEGGNELEGYQLNYVAVSGAGDNRTTGRGAAVLARFKVRVVGYPATGAGALRLDGAGQRQPRYTTAGAPGLAQRFQIEPTLWVAIEGEGLVPLDDRSLVDGAEMPIDLTPHYISQQWAPEDIAWEMWTTAPERLQVTGADRHWVLRAKAEEGAVTVFYRAVAPDGQSAEAAFVVELAAAAKRLTGLARTVVEDGGRQRLDLAEFVRDEWPEGPWHWTVQGTSSVAGEVDGAELVYEPAADWHGSATLAVTLCDAEDRCETADLVVRVDPVNDPPRISVPGPMVVAVGQQRRGPALADFIDDPDHALAELDLVVVGDQYVAADVADGAVVIRGIAAGEGQIVMRVVDPTGAQASAVLAVQVAALSAGPQIAVPAELAIAPDASMAIDLGVVDADTPLADLVWAIAVEGPIEASILPGEKPQLQLRGIEEGAAVVRIQVGDPEGNEATVAFRVEVRVPDPVSSAPDGTNGENAPDLPGEENTPVATEVEPEEPSVEIAPPETAVEEVSTPVETPTSPEGAEGEIPSPPVEAVPDTEVETEPDPAALHLGDIPDLYLAAGAAGEFSLAEYLVADAAVEWSVAGASELDVAIDADGRVVVRVPADFSGREVLLFRAQGADGQVVVDAVRVEVPAVPEGAPDPSVVAPDAEVEEAELPALELAVWPEISLVAGRSDSSLVLDQLLTSGDPQAVVWSLRGGVFVTAHIDAQRRLHLNGAQAVQGREIFYLQAQLGATVREIKLVVSVQAPIFALGTPSPLQLEAGAGELDLGAYVEGDFAASELVWELDAPPGLEVGLTGSTLQVAGEVAGQFELLITAISPTGQQREVVLLVERLESIEEIEENPTPAAEESPPKSAEGESSPGPVAESLPGPAEPVVAEPAPEIASDRRAPELALSAHLLPGGAVEFHLIVDEPLDGMPVVVADGRVLPVVARSGYYAASYDRATGAIQVVAAASDAAGNAAEARLDLSAGQGQNVLSPDGRVRVQGRLGAVLLYPDEAGYRIELAAGSTAELIFRGVEAGQGLFRHGEGGWEEVPARIAADELHAVVVDGGLYRLAKGTATQVQPAPVAYPNPFNAEMVLRYWVGAEGPVQVVVYDVLGAPIRALVQRVEGRGFRSLVWDGRDQHGQSVASGIYLIAITAGGERESRKVTLLR